MVDRSGRDALVYIIIVHWLNLPDTLECLGSLAAVDYDRFVVLVVNNGSPDFDAAAVRQALPTVRIIDAPHNLGFAGGNNLGIAAALGEGADLLLLLNNDTVVRPNLLRAMLPTFELQGAGIVGPIITYYDRPDLVWSAGCDYNRLLGYTLNPEMDKPLAQARGDRWTDFVNGCALFARREVFEVAGGFWEDYFLYFEEADLCLQAARAGWRSRVVAEPLVLHKVSSSGGIRGTNLFTPDKAYYFGRNPFLFLRRNARGLWAVTGFISQFVVVFPYYVWLSWRAHNLRVLRSYLQGMWHGLRGKTGKRPAQSSHQPA